MNKRREQIPNIPSPVRVSAPGLGALLSVTDALKRVCRELGGTYRGFTMRLSGEPQLCLQYKLPDGREKEVLVHNIEHTDDTWTVRLGNGAPVLTENRPEIIALDPENMVTI